MAEQFVPIPPGLKICESQDALSFFVELLNLNFNLTMELSSDVQGVPLTLPGVPMLTIPGYKYPINAQKVPLDVAWIGGRYPLPSPGGNFGGRGKIPTLGLPEIPPWTFLLQQISYNFQLIGEVLPDVVQVGALAPLFSMDPCSPEFINALNQQLQQVVDQVGTGGSSCPEIIVSDMTNLYAITGASDPVPPGFCFAAFADPGFPNLVTTATSWKSEHGSTQQIFGGAFPTGTPRCPMDPEECTQLVMEVDVDVPVDCSLEFGIQYTGQFVTIPIGSDGSWGAGIVGPFSGHIVSQALSIPGPFTIAGLFTAPGPVLSDASILVSNPTFALSA